jgi:Predicted transmembrane transcriptional regulator (anti-sigma factor)
MIDDPCDKCEEMMQPYLDGTLSDDEVREAERHLDGCSWCAKRYHFEERLRHYVRVAASEAMRPELKAKLAALRTPLN